MVAYIFLLQLILNDPVSIAYILQKKIYDYREFTMPDVKLGSLPTRVKDHSEVVPPRVARLLGKGLGWVEGEAEHKRMRRLVSPSLS